MEAWENVIVSSVAFAMYVPPDTGAIMHTDRAYHGFVLNCASSVKDYLFSDGTVLHTHGNELFYLPQGSSYRVKNLSSGGCYAINFHANLSDRPFVLGFRNADAVFKTFKDAELAWRTQSEFYHIVAMRAVYDLILQIHKERQRTYTPSTQRSVIAPAVETIRREFTRNELSVATLSEACGISEAYFRRIFLNEFGTSPKEYIIGLRINYAKQLLKSGDFTVTQTAQLCGYAEPCHFSREFVKRVGMSPSEYKKN
ncbi:MAG: helix-turn-helix transcriptional regulator [Clostridia bacterium]|nr:helix-turn-helix transcriptional regulator [Clostridia bacterium]